ncbi:MAG: branched-chain amino acid ABC transporter permease [Peptococcaceae bacterium BICA1-8]|nr:MAG: branched-chain amino acid ABC transporter permease [Peptococcaceae bacterium BICA1-8]
MQLLNNDFKEGAKEVVPILVGIIPFGMISGIAAINAGFSKMTALFMSVFLFAGSAQLAIVQLINNNSAVLIIVSTALIINMRFVMYSASLAPHFQHTSQKLKMLLAYLLTDQAYALSVSRFVNDNKINHAQYYMGNAVLLWLTWQLSTIMGIYLGAGIPKEWGLDFAIPLTFLVLLVNAIDDSSTATAAFVGGIIAVIGHPLPYNLGLIIAAIVGVTSGLLFELWKNR